MSWKAVFENPSEKLITSQNTRASEKKVRSAAARTFGRGKAKTIYEHGQWWVELPNGAQFSAVDIGYGDVGFEQVSEGDEDW